LDLNHKVFGVFLTTGLDFPLELGTGTWEWNVGHNLTAQIAIKCPYQYRTQAMPSFQLSSI